MNLHYLELFNTLAGELSFSKVANMLYLSQPAISIQIKKFEEELGVKLFNRSGRGLELTEDGKQLYEYSKKIFFLVDEAEYLLSSRKNSACGHIDIGASNTPGTYILPHILGEFKSSCPEITTNLHIANTYEVEKMVLENAVDFAISGGNTVYGSDIYAEKIDDEEIVFITSPESSLGINGYASREELEGAAFISHEHNSQLYKTMETILQDLHVVHNIVMNLGNVDAIKSAVSANLGISVMPVSAIKNEIKFKILRSFRIRDGEKWFYPYSLLYNKKRSLTPATRKLIDLIREKLK